jgi:tetratricopeptide (TPR) repeat protein
MAQPREIDKLQRRWQENPLGLTFAPLAEAYRKEGLFGDALELLDIGLAQHPNYVPAHIVRGRCLLDMADDHAARAAFERVVDLDPENVIALKGLADIAERAARFAEAEDRLERLLAVDRSNEEALAQLERVRSMLVTPSPGTIDLGSPPEGGPAGAGTAAGPAEAAPPAAGRPAGPAGPAVPEAAVPVPAVVDLDLPPIEMVEPPAGVAEVIEAPVPVPPPGPGPGPDPEPDPAPGSPPGVPVEDWAGPDAVLEAPFEPAHVGEPADLRPAGLDVPADPGPEPGAETGAPSGSGPSAPAGEPEAPEETSGPGAGGDLEDEAGLEAEPALVVTETMAELFLRQGHRELALAVYTQLAQRGDASDRVRQAIEQLSDELRPARPPAPPAYAAALTGGQSVRALLDELLSAVPPGGASAPPPPPAEPADEGSARFDDSFGPPPEVEPAGGAAVEGETADGGGTPGADDIEQFNSWLRGLKG